MLLIALTAAALCLGLAAERRAGGEPPVEILALGANENLRTPLSRHAGLVGHGVEILVFVQQRDQRGIAVIASRSWTPCLLGVHDHLIEHRPQMGQYGSHLIVLTNGHREVPPRPTRDLGDLAPVVVEKS